MFSLFKLCFKLSKLLKTSWGRESFSPVGFSVLGISGCLQRWLSFSCLHRAPGRRVWKGMCGLLWKAAACCNGVQQQSETGSQAASSGQCCLLCCSLSAAGAGSEALKLSLPSPCAECHSISQRFPSAGSLPQGAVPLELTDTWGAGQKLSS